LLDLRSCWIVFIHVVRGRPGGFLQFSEGEAVMILLASVSSGILAMWPKRERRHAWTIADRRGCPVVRLTSCRLATLIFIPATIFVLSNVSNGTGQCQPGLTLTKTKFLHKLYLRWHQIWSSRSCLPFRYCMRHHESLIQVIVTMHTLVMQSFYTMFRHILPSDCLNIPQNQPVSTKIKYQAHQYGFFVFCELFMKRKVSFLWT